MTIEIFCIIIVAKILLLYDVIYDYKNEFCDKKLPSLAVFSLPNLQNENAREESKPKELHFQLSNFLKTKNYFPTKSHQSKKHLQHITSINSSSFVRFPLRYNLGKRHLYMPSKSKLKKLYSCRVRHLLLIYRGSDFRKALSFYKFFDNV